MKERERRNKKRSANSPNKDFANPTMHAFGGVLSRKRLRVDDDYDEDDGDDAEPATPKPVPQLLPTPRDVPLPIPIVTPAILPTAPSPPDMSPDEDYMDEEEERKPPLPPVVVVPAVVEKAKPVKVVTTKPVEAAKEPERRKMEASPERIVTPRSATAAAAAPRDPQTPSRRDSQSQPDLSSSPRKSTTTTDVPAAAATRRLSEAHSQPSPRRSSESHDPPFARRPSQNQQDSASSGRPPLDSNPSPIRRSSVRQSSQSQEPAASLHHRRSESHDDLHHHHSQSSTHTHTHRSDQPLSAGLVGPHSPAHVRMDPSMFGKKPEEDLVLYVSEFLWRHLQPGSGGAQIEIEGKLGLILNKHTRERIRLPIATESVLINDGSYRFDSNMSMAQHAHFNRLLNGLMQPGCKTRYVHTKEIDQYYQSGGGNKTRVSRDQKTGQVREVIMKKRIADIEIHLPNSPLDCRISVNWEIPIPQPPKDATTLFRRHKDRLSYSHEAFRVDLTQVRQFDDRDVEKQLTHELEVEFIRIGDLLAEKEKRQAGKMNGFTENVDVFLNNLRYLSRKSVITH